MAHTDASTASAAPRGPAALGPWAAGWLIVVIGLSAIGVIGNLTIAADGAAQVRIVLPRLTPGIAGLLAGLGAAMAAGAALLLFARRRAGFWVVLGAAALGLAVNLWIGVAPGRALAGLAGPLVTWLFLRPRWRSLV